MSIHLLERRKLVHVDGNQSPAFPSPVRTVIAFAPHDIFGVEGDSLRTTVRAGKEMTMLYHAFTGAIEITGDHIEPVDLTKEYGHIDCVMEGNELELSFSAETPRDLRAVLTSANLYIPLFLSVHFHHFVWIIRFSVEVDSGKFNYVIEKERASVSASGSDEAHSRVEQAFDDWAHAGLKYDRLLSACLYLRHAYRLRQNSPSLPYLAEIVLNLTKALEIIFTADRDRLRERAEAWGFTREQIEESMVPLFLIRNEIDVAHGRRFRVS